ncbi:ROK family protein [Liquorilactobacillus cacaonum]|uniref:ROK family sugar kinase n=1 Tax=Liquorilactobacillus cacaonum DSM 21116 TaxID=1423729 RepID=A0A0R2CLM1_9LACO|nr:ROK family protein [Liquorilactobacillus cacaonum]KRM91986.1 ROK family sugar kinase [Liquorilactobacillus cacaonum DSM 21116]
MTKLAVVDIGGTTIKFATWDESRLLDIHRIQTPSDLTSFYDLLATEIEKIKEKIDIVGVAISSPGAVNKVSGVIEGASAIPYIHNFDMQSKLKKIFDLPVTLENDANCAALAELAVGAGEKNQSLAFLVIGSGVGGTVVIDRKIWHGAHLFGGEFGYMLADDEHTLSNLGSPVELGKWYQQKTGKKASGKKVFELAKQDDLIAKEGIERMISVLATAVYNIQYSFDPEKIIIGGSISENPELLNMIDEKIAIIRRKVGIASIKPIVEACQYKGEANLRGAVEDYITTQGGK